LRSGIVGVDTGTANAVALNYPFANVAGFVKILEVESVVQHLV
jgi:hypothetical protein